jgi:type III secretion protein N (ATPase)
MKRFATTFACAGDAANIDTRLAAWLNSARQRTAARRCGVETYGRLERVSATLIEAHLPDCEIGHLCELVHPSDDRDPTLAEVIGFDGPAVLLAPLASTDGLTHRTRVRSLGRPHQLAVGAHLLGCVLDGVGRLLRTAGSERAQREGESCPRIDIIAPAPSAIERPRIDEKLATGVRAIDALATIGRGQRVALIAAPGCGKTTLVGALARHVDAEIVVLALVGERGRELNEFLERELDAGRAARSVVVCATSDRSPMERVRAAFTATAIADGFRAQGKDVLLLVDSLTRVARAQREIGLAAGEPPGRQGWPSSVYSLLPRLVERAGRATRGSITAFYTVLSDSNGSDPIAEEAVSLLDGHIVLSTELAARGHFPAIDVLASLSRTMDAIVDESHRRDARRLRALLARYGELELLLKLGEYEAGSDMQSDDAIARYSRIVAFLQQDTRAASAWDETLEALNAVVYQ